jgi:RNA-directed DNA polymerase
MRSKKLSEKRQWISRSVARAFLSVWPNREQMVQRATDALGYKWTFLDGLAERVVRQLDRGAPLPPFSRLSRLIGRDPGLLGVWSMGRLVDAKEYDPEAPDAEIDETDTEALKFGIRLEVRGLYLVPRTMRPARAWSVPSIETEVDLLGFLGMEDSELFHLAGLGRRERVVAEGPLRNYVYRWLRKRGGRARLIEAPKFRLKQAQRRILRSIVAAVPSSEAAHGFKAGTSILTHALEHAGHRVLVRMDLAEFFPSISGARVTAIFHMMGYPERVAKLLAALTTNAVPSSVFGVPEAYGVDPWLWSLLSSRHLPPGAPSSPALANLCSFRLDRRLAGLAKGFGARYGRYADDLTFSGGRDFERRTETFTALVTAVAVEEGFRVNARKTRIMRAGVRQKMTGLVVNERPNISRDDYDRLKAIIHNCVRFGPASQNREARPDFRAHLRGRIAFVRMVHAAHGAKLEALFDQIPWGE